jgi:hypothetical protein
MAAVKLRVEQARLTAMESKLEASQADVEPAEYTRYEDLPPLSPEDEIYFREKVQTMFYREGLAQYAQWRCEIERAWESMNAAMGGAGSRIGQAGEPYYSCDSILPDDEEYYQARLRQEEAEEGRA